MEYIKKYVKVFWLKYMVAGLYICTMKDWQPYVIYGDSLQS
jgi:hypothetical protein